MSSAPAAGAWAVGLATISDATGRVLDTRYPAPQLGVFNIALSIKPLIGLGVLAAALPTIIQRVVLVMYEVAVSLKAMIIPAGN